MDFLKKKEEKSKNEKFDFISQKIQSIEINRANNFKASIYVNFPDDRSITLSNDSLDRFKQLELLSKNEHEFILREINKKLMSLDEDDIPKAITKLRDDLEKAIHELNKEPSIYLGVKVTCGKCGKLNEFSKEKMKELGIGALLKTDGKVITLKEKEDAILLCECENDLLSNHDISEWIEEKEDNDEQEKK